MRSQDDRYEILPPKEEIDGFSALSRKSISQSQPQIVTAMAVTARFHSIDLDNQPLICDVPGLPGEVVPARTTISLVSGQVGSSLVVLFEHADVRRPIIIGVLQREPSSGDMVENPPAVSVQADNDRIVLSAEREIVLRCGLATITLTKAGKVLIQGAYVSSRSSGVNRIKGGSVQIN